MFINLTPHEINLYTEEGVKTFPSAGYARVATTEQFRESLGGAPVYAVEYGDIEGLPEPQDDTVFVVSLMVLQALGGTRPDVVAPNTGPTQNGAVRDPDGKIVGIRSFSQL
jgi:hypothetical protein